MAVSPFLCLNILYRKEVVELFHVVLYYPIETGISTAEGDTTMNTLNLADYGIEQNKVETAKIQKVFDEAKEHGGLTVVVPKGTYIAGTLNIWNASIYLEKGAVLKASPDLADYVDNGFVHNEMKKTVSFLYAMHEEDICISGEGTIDLSGNAFYEMDVADVPDYGVEFSEEQKAECTRPIKNRPTQPIFFYDCHNITIKDIKIQDAPCWTMSFHACEDIRILDVLIKNNMIIPNNDGMHFCGSKNVIIKGCNITAGDDCIALSAITDWDRPCENFVISDCIMRSVSKSIVFGYIHSMIRNVTMSNCVIYDSQRGICFMALKGTGLIEHILIENVRIDTHVRAGNWWGNGEAVELLALEHNYDGYLNPAPDRNLPVTIRDIRFKNLSCTSENVIAVIGEDNIEDVSFDGLYFEKKKSANRYLKGDRVIDVSPARVKVEVPEDGEYWLYSAGCRNLHIQNETIHAFEGKTLKAFVK